MQLIVRWTRLVFLFLLRESLGFLSLTLEDELKINMILVHPHEMEEIQLLPPQLQIYGLFQSAFI